MTDFNEEYHEGIKNIQYDYIVKDGKAYLSSDELVEGFNEMYNMMMLQGALFNEPVRQQVAAGIAFTQMIIFRMATEAMRREAEKLVVE